MVDGQVGDPAERLTGPDEGSASHSSPLRRRLAWSGGAGVFVLLLIFVPPLVNANRYQRQIARSISASLGRTVHLDNATLHLLPVPGLTLSNFVVSEDPAFGDEPTLRADTVEATLRLASLWRRPVEFSTVRFLEPHVNLVRNAQGRWNLADVLLHASHVQTAPTAQAHAGPAPRFPYIEATGGRLNLKLAEEKLPFSITDADFALWLPSPNQWRVRLKGQPARTDTSLTDPGILRMEGGLQRAETAAGIQLNLQGSWHNAPLGEASRLLTGDDLGWRGTLNLDAELAGTMQESTLGTQVTLGGLHRAEFAPEHPLDLQIRCGARLSAAVASLSQLACAMPDSAPTPLTLTASSVDLARPRQTPLSLQAENVPLHWAMLWAALFSARVPTEVYPEGKFEVHLHHLDSASAAVVPVNLSRGKRGSSRAANRQRPVLNASAWTGEIDVHLPAPPVVSSTTSKVDGMTPPRTELVWRPVASSFVSQGGAGHGAAGTPPVPGLLFAMTPVAIPLMPGTPLTVTATIGSSGYSVGGSGLASTAALLLPARYLPQLGDGLEDVLPGSPTDLQAARVEFTCVHSWGAAQTCTSLRPSPAGSRTAPRVGLTTSSPAAGLPPADMPTLLAPRSLSPFDRDPRLGGSPVGPTGPGQPGSQPGEPSPHL